MRDLNINISYGSKIVLGSMIYSSSCIILIDLIILVGYKFDIVCQIVAILNSFIYLVDLAKQPEGLQIPGQIKWVVPSRDACVAYSLVYLYYISILISIISAFIIYHNNRYKLRSNSIKMISFMSIFLLLAFFVNTSLVKLKPYYPGIDLSYLIIKACIMLVCLSYIIQVLIVNFIKFAISTYRGVTNG